MRATAIGKRRRNGFAVTLYEVAENPAGMLVWREIGRVACASFSAALDYAANEWVDYPTLDITADGDAVDERQAMRLTGMTLGPPALDRLRDLIGETAT